VAPAFPTVRVAVLGNEGLAAVLEQVDVVELTASGSPLEEVDLVLLDVSAAVNMPQPLADRLQSWWRLPGRQPLVLWEGWPVPSDRLKGLEAVIREANRVWVADPSRIPLFEDLGAGRVGSLDSGFSPVRHNPVGWSLPLGQGIQWREEEGLRLGERDGRPLVALLDTEGALPPQVFSLQASGVPVLGAGELGKANAEEVAPEFLEGRAAELIRGGEPLERASVRARRRAFSRHTGALRAWELLTDVGLSVPHPHRRVAGLLVSNKPDRVPSALNLFLAQSYPHKELVLALHGDRTEFREAEAALRTAQGEVPTLVLSFPETLPLGTCLNEAAEASTAPLLAKIDDDDLYGPTYLEDAVYAILYSDADLVGKATHYTYLEERDATVLSEPGKEERYVSYVPGPTFLLRRSLWEQVQFPARPARVDSIFIRGCRAVGATIYSNHRFNFTWMRRADGHTWSVEPEHFLARGRVAWEGLHPERVSV
jgi:hypothetical protein